MLGVSVSTVWRWVDARKLAAFRVGPKAIRIKRTDVEAAIQPIADRKKVDAMNAIDIGEEGAILPMTLEQAERGMAALAAGKELREAIRARRKGEPLSDSATIIRKAREERSGQI